MDPRDINISDYTYHLPADRIAMFPLEERDASKLLVLRDHKISDHRYRDLPKLLPSDAVLVFNETRVIEARLLFVKPTGGTIEIFCLEHHPKYGSVQQAMQQMKAVYWHCMVGGASKWKGGQVLTKSLKHNGENISLSATYEGKEGDNIIIRFSWQPEDLSFAEVLHLAGQMPLPPYIKRHVEASDRDRYQTVFAKEEGSVAAPTAGLHFTPQLIQELAANGTGILKIILHVGAGTFKPVKAARMKEHQMHGEFIDVSLNTIDDLISSIDKKIIPVGTTSLRTLESLYWLGLQCFRGRNIFSSSLPHVSQWEPYDEPADIDTATSLRSLSSSLRAAKKEKLIARTEIIIAPGYHFRVVKGLITNFHQPGSTLLLLVAAMIGDSWKKVYEYALNHEYRFLSYGDGCLFLP